MPVLIKLTTILLPGNFERATVVPIDIPMNKLMSVADPDTWRDRKVMLITSGSKVIKSQNAFLMPSRMRSILCLNSKKVQISKSKCQIINI
jgi:hypothetical protein